ncbi:MAG: carboxypeptidase regulatory-like domain-containing protein, partial [Candidatus Aenigmatarchaeota archaeon]
EAVLVGYVFDNNRTTIVGATVRAGGYSVITNGSGYYIIALPAGLYNMSANKTGYYDQQITGIVAYNGDMTENNFTLAVVSNYSNSSLNFTGVVKDVIGNMLNTFLVFAGNDIYNTSSLNGLYNLEMNGGLYNVTLSATCYFNQTMTNVLVAENRTGDFTLYPLQGLITGVIKDSEDAMNISGADVLLMNGNTVVLSTTTDANGSYVLNVGGGSYNLAISKQGYVYFTKSINLTCVPIEENVSLIPYGIVSGTIGNGASAVIELRQNDVVLYSTTADSIGTYSLIAPVGTYQLVISKPGYQTQSSTIVLTKSGFVSSPSLQPVVITQTSGGGGGGGGGISINKYEQSFLLGGLQPGEHIVKVTVDKIPVTNITFNLTKYAGSMNIIIAKLLERPISIPTLFNLYSYLDIYVTGVDITTLKNIQINFKVSNTWLTNYTKEQVRLFRYYDKEWNMLDTVFVSNDSNYHYFSSITPGLSYFAIAAVSETNVIYPNITTPENLTPPTLPNITITNITGGQGITGAVTADNDQWLLGLVVIIIIAIIIAFYYIYGRENKNTEEKKS